MIECKLCNRDFKFLSSHIIHFHGKTIEDYKKEFGNVPLVSEEEKIKISKGVSVAHKDGKLNTEEFRINQSNFMKQKWQDKDFKNNQKQKHEQFLNSIEGQEYKIRVSQKLSEIKKQEWQNVNHIYNTQEYIDKVSEGRKKQWKNPEMARKWMISNHAKPNTKEQKVTKILNELFPNVFEYNGDARLNIVIDGKIPDWIDLKNNKIIELFGNFWHGEIKTGHTMEENEIAIKFHYQRFNFKCLVIWEKELEYEQPLIEKLKEFICQV